MANGAKKGSSFERKICKRLSLWWTGGERDDVFWRSSQSGGRATQRAKSGKRTYGSYGDIAAVDPIGEPLLKLFTIELKRGRSHGHPEDLVDCAATKVQRPFEKCLMQAITAFQAAQSHSWLLICQRDRKVVMVYAEFSLIKRLDTSVWPVRYRVLVNQEKGPAMPLHFAGLPFEDFLKRVAPRDIRNFL